MNSSLMVSEIFINLLNEGIINDVLEFSCLFGQIIYKRLKKFLEKLNSNSIDENNDIYDLKQILIYLEKFIVNRENLLRIIVQNDFNFLKRPLFEEIMTLLFEVKNKL